MFEPGDRIYIRLRRDFPTAGYFVDYEPDTRKKRCFVDYLTDDPYEPGKLIRKRWPRPIAVSRVWERYADITGERDEPPNDRVIR